MTAASPLPPARAPRGAAWAWPLLLALAFVAALAAWLQWSDARDAEQAQATLIADALSLEGRVASWVGDEQGRVDRLAAALPARIDDATLLGLGAVARGLQRDWISVTVLDAGNRIVAHVPEQAPRPEPRSPAAGVDEGGVSAHLSAPLRGGGKIVVRFAPALLLRQALPWWLARKYDVRLVDGLGQFIAGSGDPRPSTDRYSHRVSVEPALVDTWLELTAREVPLPWWRTALPPLMAAFLALTAAATATLRRQMREVARTEREWRTEVAWRRAIEDALTVGLRGRDLDGRVTHVSRAFCDLVGYAPEQLLGRLPPMPYWPPDGHEVRMQRHLRNLAGGAPRNGYETQWVRADGTPLEVMIFEAPLVDALGAQVGWMGSVIDITERRRGEERERRQVEALATQARLTMLGEVASALAHQLNQPLTAITGYSAGVLRSLERAGYGDRAVLAALRGLGEQAAEAGRIVQHIRGFLTRRAPQRERCAIAEVAERATRLLRRDLERRGVELRLDLGAELPDVDADPVLIEQVLINLVRNAADETAGTAPALVHIGAAVEGEALRVAVDDNGGGLQGRPIEALSAPFYTTKAEGMGMGLAICRSVVEAHHGALAAAPGPLGGARLSFTLPLFRQAS